MRKWALALGGVVACGSAHEDVASSNATVALLPGPTEPNVGRWTVEEPGTPVLGPCITGRPHSFCYTLTSKLDNPELRTKLPHVPFARFRNAREIRHVPMEIDIQARTDVSISPGDLHFVLDGLVDTPVDFQNIPLFELESAVQSNLFVYPEVTASYVAPGTADLYTRGIRLGYPPLDVRSQDVSTDFSLDHTITAVRVALDPTVVLTPVQVFAAQSCSFRDYDGLGSVEGALALYDQVPNFSELDSIEPGLLLGTDRSEWTDFGPTTLPAKSQTWLSTDLQEYQPLRFAGSGYYTPDSVWRDCGVQFRLVRFGKFETDDSYNSSGHKTCPNYAGGHVASQDPEGVCGDLYAQLTNCAGYPRTDSHRHRSRGFTSRRQCGHSH